MTAEFGRLAPFLVRYRRRWAVAFAALALVHVIEAAAPLLLKEGVNRIDAGDFNLGGIVAALLALTLARYLTLNFGRRENALVSAELASDLRIAIFAQIQRQSHAFFTRFALGDLMARATNDVEAVRQFFRGAVHQIVSLVTLSLVAPLLMIMQSATLTLLVLAMLVVFIAASWIIAGLIRRQSSAVLAEFGALTDRIQYTLQGLRTIQSLAQEGREIEAFANEAYSYAVWSFGLVRLIAALNAFVIAGSGFITLVVVGFGGAQILSGKIDLGTLIAFIFYLAMVVGVLRSCSWPVFLLLRAATACRRIFAVLDEIPDIEDPPQALPMQEVRGAFSLRDVGYRFPNGVVALANIRLEIPAGAFVVVLGRVGAGKSTLLRLLARQLDPVGGAVLLDGADLRQLPLTQLRREIALASQDAFLFAAPFTENISYDDPSRAEDAVCGAAAAASLSDVIESLPDRYATLIGEKGITLSGGQKQRTNLARSFVRNAPVLLIDDCMSALDTETEARMLRELKDARRGRTTILVSQCPTAVQYADEIVVLDNGRIVARDAAQFFETATRKAAGAEVFGVSEHEATAP